MPWRVLPNLVQYNVYRVRNIHSSNLNHVRKIHFEMPRVKNRPTDGVCEKIFWSSCKIPQNKNPFRIEKNPLFKPQGFPLFFCEMPMVIWELPIRSAQHFSIPKGMKSDQYEGIEMTPSILNHFNVSNAFNFVNFSVRKSTRQNCWIGRPDKFSFLKI